jgi:hypothetical protein
MTTNAEKAKQLLKSKKSTTKKDLTKESENINEETKVSWNNGQRRFLLQQLLDQKLKKGNMGDTGNFRKQVWQTVLDAFNEKYSVEWSIQSLKTEYGYQKARFQLFETLMDYSGQPFSFNELTNRVEADHDQWDALIDSSTGQKLANLKYLRNKEYHNVDILQCLLGGEIATGEYAQSLVADDAAGVQGLDDPKEQAEETPSRKSNLKRERSISSASQGSTKKSGVLTISNAMERAATTLASALKADTNHGSDSRIQQAIKLLNEAGPHGTKLVEYIKLLKDPTNSEVSNVHHRYSLH